MRWHYHAIMDGVILIAVGALIWLSNWGILHIQWRRDWPAILVALGIIELGRCLFTKKA